MSKNTNEITPRHLWTHEGKEVLIVRFVASDGSSYSGKDRSGKNVAFKHPTKVGETVVAKDWMPDDKCGGGIHGWPWGFAVGDGKEPDWSATWLVYGVDPKDIVGGSGEMLGKCKFRTGTVRHVGTWHSAMLFVLNGQMAWVHYSASGSAANSGERGSAANSAWRGSAANSGWRGSAANSGASGSAANSGERGSAANSGESGSAANSAWRGSAANSGASGSAANSGASGSAANSGERGSAANSAWSGSAANSGERGIASSTGEDSTVESVGAGSVAISTADEVTWIAHPGSVFVHRYGKFLKIATFKGTKAVDGERITFRCGKIIKREKPLK